MTSIWLQDPDVMSRKMFVGNLASCTDDESFRAYFSKFGKLEACMVLMRGEGIDQRTRGFGFLLFEDARSVAAVLSQGHVVDGRLVDPKHALTKWEQFRTTRIFVGGVHPEATASELGELFGQFGPVLDATLNLDSMSGRPRGFGFVMFEHRRSAIEALKRTDLTLRGKAIETRPGYSHHDFKRHYHHIDNPMQSVDMMKVPRGRLHRMDFPHPLYSSRHTTPYRSSRQNQMFLQRPRNGRPYTRPDFTFEEAQKFLREIQAAGQLNKVAKVQTSSRQSKGDSLRGNSLNANIVTVKPESDQACIALRMAHMSIANGGGSAQQEQGHVRTGRTLKDYKDISMECGGNDQVL